MRQTSWRRGLTKISRTMELWLHSKAPLKMLWFGAFFAHSRTPLRCVNTTRENNFTLNLFIFFKLLIFKGKAR